VNASLLVPGLGQLYSGHWVKGIGMLLVTIATIGYGAWSIFGASGNTLQGLWSLLLLLGLYGFGIIDAYRSAQPYYSRRIAFPQDSHNLWYGIFLSQILPGLGHLYQQRVGMGGVLLAAGLVSALLANTDPRWLPIPPLIWAVGCYHLYGRGAGKQHGRQTIALITLGVFLLRLSLGSVPSWVQATVEQCIVPSESMLPTLQVNDRVFVRRDRHYQPQTRDIIVFQVPPTVVAITQVAPRSLFVKRVIGLPGQQVQIANGQVFINRQPLAEPYLQTAPDYQWGPEIIPADRYFVLGDNRNASSDSHIWGYVPAPYILGKAYKIYWPRDRIQSLG
jgi:signal peptidase I